MKRAVRDASGNLSEFPLVLIILLIIIVFPLVNALGIATGAAVGYLTVRQTANAAATQETFFFLLVGYETAG